MNIPLIYLMGKGNLREGIRKVYGTGPMPPPIPPKRKKWWRRVLQQLARKAK